MRENALSWAFNSGDQLCFRWTLRTAGEWMKFARSDFRNEKERGRDRSLLSDHGGVIADAVSVIVWRFFSGWVETERVLGRL